MAVGERTDPYLGYRFAVEVDSLIVAGFSEVSGLEVRMEPERYREGGVNTHAHALPTRTDFPNLVFRRGLTASDAFWSWMRSSVDGRIERRNGRVLLLDAAGEESWGWEFTEAYPVRWAGPELNAARGAVAVETLELAHHGLSKLDGVPTE